MNINFEVPVVDYAVPGRTSKKKLVLGAVQIAVDVPEYSTSEAPTILESALLGAGHHRTLFTKHRFKEFDGRIFIQCGVDPDASGCVRCPVFGRIIASPAPFVGVAAVLKEEIFTNLGEITKHNFYPYESAVQLAKNWMHTLPLTNFAEHDVKFSDGKLLQTCISAFEKDASNLIMVDGELYSEIAEPILAVGFSWERQKWSVHLYDLASAFDGSWSSNAFGSCVAAFPANRVSEAFRMLDDLNIDAHMGDDVCDFVSEAWVPTNDFRHESVGLALNAAYHRAQATLKAEPGLITSINQSLRCQLLSEEIKEKVTLQSISNPSDELPALLEKLISAPIEVRSIFMTDRMARIGKVILDRWQDREVDMNLSRPVVSKAP